MACRARVEPGLRTVQQVLGALRVTGGQGRLRGRQEPGGSPRGLR
ncbi:hypothetical protein ACFQX6_04765 [Streptosporangium lutulentum]